MVRALCLQLGLGLGPGNGIIPVFFSLCVKVIKIVLLSWHVTVQRSDVRPTLRDVMMMYSKDRYMKNLPTLSPPYRRHHANSQFRPVSSVTHHILWDRFLIARI